METEYPSNRSLQSVPFGKSREPRQKIFGLIDVRAVYQDLFNFRVVYRDIV